MGIRHRADNGFRKFLVLSKLCLGGQLRKSEILQVSYPRLLIVTFRPGGTFFGSPVLPKRQNDQLTTTAELKLDLVN